MRDPKVSVIVATRNRPVLLNRAVDSILGQSHQDFEMIIIDDASDEESQENLEEIKRKDARIKLIRNEKNLGPGKTRNIGIANAKGEYIAIMDDDDISLPQRLFQQQEILNNDQGIGLVFSSVGWMNENLEVYEIFPSIVRRGEFPKEPEQVFKLLYLESNKIPDTTIMVRKSIMQNVGYPETIWIGLDWLLCLRLAALGVRMMAIPEPLVLVRRDSATSGLMSNKESAFKAQRQVLYTIRTWLTEKDIHEFDSLHRLAFSCQLINEARFWCGFRGLGLATKAIIVAPNNSKAWSTLFWFIDRSLKKTRRLFASKAE